MAHEADFDTVTILRSKTLYRPDRRAAILLEGHRRANEPYVVAFEVTLETCAILRAEIAKAEAFLSAKSGTA
jgi:hypothetical protein